jgi:hypothetical protein
MGGFWVTHLNIQTLYNAPNPLFAGLLVMPQQVGFCRIMFKKTSYCQPLKREGAAQDEWEAPVL